MKRKLIALILVLVSAFSLFGACAEKEIPSLISDTVENGCVKLPITWNLACLENVPESIVYTVLKDGKEYLVSEETSETGFVFTPEESGAYILKAVINGGEAEYVSEPVEVMETLYLGVYEQDRDNTAPEPIEWRVLDVQDGKALILSEYVLRPGSYFNPEWIKFKYTYWSGSYIGECGRNNKPGRGDTPSYKVSPTTVPMKDGSMGTDADLYYVHARYWLNGEFYENAFTDSEKARILLTLNENKDNPDSGIAGGPDTEDHVFFLSYEEFNRYFKTRDEGRCEPTDSAKSMHKDMRENKYCYWWLRTPGEFRCNAMYIHPNGRVSTYGSDVGHDSLGYRPAMWITIGG